MGARGAVVRGTCNTVLGRALSSALWLAAAAGSVHLWIEYVKSALKLADPPSRMRPLTDKPLPVEGVSVGAPRLFFDLVESSDALTRALFLRPTAVPGVVCEAWPCSASPLSLAKEG